MSNRQLRKAQRCPECAGRMTWKTKVERLEYKGRTKSIRTRAWWCNGCGEGIVAGAALKAAERAYLVLKAEVDGILVPEEVAAIRKRLGLSQRRAGELLGGGSRAFQKYESGAVAVSAAMSNLLRLLDRDPRRLKELEQIAEAS